MATLSDLTPREEEVLRLVLAGRTNSAFVVQISISEKLSSFILIRFPQGPGANAPDGGDKG